MLVVVNGVAPAVIRKRLHAMADLEASITTAAPMMDVVPNGAIMPAAKLRRVDVLNDAGSGIIGNLVQSMVGTPPVTDDVPRVGDAAVAAARFRRAEDAVAWYRLRKTGIPSSATTVRAKLDRFASRPLWFHEALLADARNPKDPALVAGIKGLVPAGSQYSTDARLNTAIQMWHFLCVAPLRANIAPTPCRRQGDLFVLSPSRRLIHDELIRESLELKRRAGLFSNGAEWTPLRPSPGVRDLTEVERVAVQRVVLRGLVDDVRWTPEELRFRAELLGLSGVPDGFLSSTVAFMQTLGQRSAAFYSSVVEAPKAVDFNMDRLVEQIMHHAPAGSSESNQRQATYLANVWLNHVLNRAVVSEENGSATIVPADLRWVHKRMLAGLHPLVQLAPAVRVSAALVEAYLENRHPTHAQVAARMSAAGLRPSSKSLADARQRIDRLISAPIWLHEALMALGRDFDPRDSGVMRIVFAVMPYDDLFADRELLERAIIVWSQFCTKPLLRGVAACAVTDGIVTLTDPQDALEFVQDRIAISRSF